jgi:hypothetical protein
MHKKTILDYFHETGTAGQISHGLFVLGIVFVLFVHFKRLGFRHRMAMLPFSFLPFVIGCCGATLGVIDVTRPGCFGFTPVETLAYFGEVIRVMAFVSIESAVLLFFTFLLFLSKYAEINEQVVTVAEPGVSANSPSTGG